MVDSSPAGVDAADDAASNENGTRNSENVPSVVAADTVDSEATAATTAAGPPIEDGAGGGDDEPLNPALMAAAKLIDAAAASDADAPSPTGGSIPIGQVKASPVDSLENAHSASAGVLSSECVMSDVEPTSGRNADGLSSSNLMEEPNLGLKEASPVVVASSGSESVPSAPSPQETSNSTDKSNMEQAQTSGASGDINIEGSGDAVGIDGAAATNEDTSIGTASGAVATIEDISIGAASGAVATNQDTNISAASGAGAVATNEDTGVGADSGAVATKENTSIDTASGAGAVATKDDANTSGESTSVPDEVAPSEKRMSGDISKSLDSDVDAGAKGLSPVAVSKGAKPTKADAIAGSKDFPVLTPNASVGDSPALNVENTESGNSGSSDGNCLSLSSSPQGEAKEGEAKEGDLRAPAIDSEKVDANSGAGHTEELATAVGTGAVVEEAKSQGNEPSAADGVKSDPRVVVNACGVPASSVEVTSLPSVLVPTAGSHARLADGVSVQVESDQHKAIGTVSMEDRAADATMSAYTESSRSPTNLSLDEDDTNSALSESEDDEQTTGVAVSKQEEGPSPMSSSLQSTKSDGDRKIETQDPAKSRGVDTSAQVTVKTHPVADTPASTETQPSAAAAETKPAAAAESASLSPAAVTSEPREEVPPSSKSSSEPPATGTPAQVSVKKVETDKKTDEGSTGARASHVAGSSVAASAACSVTVVSGIAQVSGETPMESTTAAPTKSVISSSSAAASQSSTQEQPTAASAQSAAGVNVQKGTGVTEESRLDPMASPSGDSTAGSSIAELASSTSKDVEKKFSPPTATTAAAAAAAGEKSTSTRSDSVAKNAEKKFLPTTAPATAQKSVPIPSKSAADTPIKYSYGVVKWFKKARQHGFIVMESTASSSKEVLLPFRGEDFVQTGGAGTTKKRVTIAAGTRVRFVSVSDDQAGKRASKVSIAPAQKSKKVSSSSVSQSEASLSSSLQAKIDSTKKSFVSPKSKPPPIVGFSSDAVKKSAPPISKPKATPKSSPASAVRRPLVAASSSGSASSKAKAKGKISAPAAPKATQKLPAKRTVRVVTATKKPEPVKRSVAQKAAPSKAKPTVVSTVPAPKRKLAPVSPSSTKAQVRKSGVDVTPSKKRRVVTVKAPIQKKAPGSPLDTDKDNIVFKKPKRNPSVDSKGAPLGTGAKGAPPRSTNTAPSAKSAKTAKSPQATKLKSAPQEVHVTVPESLEKSLKSKKASPSAKNERFVIELDGDDSAPASAPASSTSKPKSKRTVVNVTRKRSASGSSDGKGTSSSSSAPAERPRVISSSSRPPAKRAKLASSSSASSSSAAAKGGGGASRKPPNYMGDPPYQVYKGKITKFDPTVSGKQVGQVGFQDRDNYETLTFTAPQAFVRDTKIEHVGQKCEFKIWRNRDGKRWAYQLTTTSGKFPSKAAMMKKRNATTTAGARDRESNHTSRPAPTSAAADDSEWSHTSYDVRGRRGGGGGGGRDSVRVADRMHSSERGYDRYDGPPVGINMRGPGPGPIVHDLRFAEILPPEMLPRGRSRSPPPLRPRGRSRSPPPLPPRGRSRSPPPHRPAAYDERHHRGEGRSPPPPREHIRDRQDGPPHRREEFFVHPNRSPRGGYPPPRGRSRSPGPERPPYMPHTRSRSPPGGHPRPHREMHVSQKRRHPSPLRAHTPHDTRDRRPVSPPPRETRAPPRDRRVSPPRRAHATEHRQARGDDRGRRDSRDLHRPPPQDDHRRRVADSLPHARASRRSPSPARSSRALGGVPNRTKPPPPSRRRSRSPRNSRHVPLNRSRVPRDHASAKSSTPMVREFRNNPRKEPTIPPRARDHAPAESGLRMIRDLPRHPPKDSSSVPRDRAPADRESSLPVIRDFRAHPPREPNGAPQGRPLPSSATAASYVQRPTAANDQHRRIPRSTGHDHRATGTRPLPTVASQRTATRKRARSPQHGHGHGHGRGGLPGGGSGSGSGAAVYHEPIPQHEPQHDARGAAACRVAPDPQQQHAARGAAAARRVVPQQQQPQQQHAIRGSAVRRAVTPPQQHAARGAQQQQQHHAARGAAAHRVVPPQQQPQHAVRGAQQHHAAREAAVRRGVPQQQQQRHREDVPRQQSQHHHQDAPRQQSQQQPPTAVGSGDPATYSAGGDYRGAQRASPTAIYERDNRSSASRNPPPQRKKARVDAGYEPIGAPTRSVHDLTDDADAAGIDADADRPLPSLMDQLTPLLRQTDAMIRAAAELEQAPPVAAPARRAEYRAPHAQDFSEPSRARASGYEAIEAPPMPSAMVHTPVAPSVSPSSRSHPRVKPVASGPAAVSAAARAHAAPPSRSHERVSPVVPSRGGAVVNPRLLQPSAHVTTSMHSSVAVPQHLAFDVAPARADLRTQARPSYTHSHSHMISQSVPAMSTMAPRFPATAVGRQQVNEPAAVGVNAIGHAISHPMVAIAQPQAASQHVATSAAAAGQRMMVAVPGQYQHATAAAAGQRIMVAVPGQYQTTAPGQHVVPVSQAARATAPGRIPRALMPHQPAQQAQVQQGHHDPHAYARRGW